MYMQKYQLYWPTHTSNSTFQYHARFAGLATM